MTATALSQSRSVQVRFGYSLALRNARPDEDPVMHHPLLAMLGALHSGGSIGAAAKALDLSYRHVWGELRRWEADLGRALVHKAKGQPAHLTPFGERLLHVERQAQARFAAQIKALRSELERAFVTAYDD